MFEFSGIQKTFGGVRALDGVTLRVERGALVGVVGANGAGKSTLLSCAAGFLFPDAGSVAVEGASLYSAESRVEARRKLRRVGCLLQQPLLYLSLTVRENLALFSALYDLDGAPERIADVAQRLHLEHELDKEIRHCSQGTVKRASVARALLPDPEFLLLDEPFANLDPFGREVVRRELESRLRRGRGALVALHEPEMLRGAGARFVSLQRGRITGEFGDNDLGTEAFRQIYRSDAA